MESYSKVRETLNAQLEHEDLRGVVLVKDASTASDKTEKTKLREQGVIFTLAQLFSDARKYIKGIHTQPNAEIYLQRISLGINEILANWTTGKIKNKELLKGLNRHASKVVCATWHAQGLPERFEEPIVEMFSRRNCDPSY